MQNSRNKKALQIGLFILIAIVVLGVGYAAISSVNLIINGNTTTSVNQNNFKVHFTGAHGITGSTGVSGTSNIDSQDDTKAIFDVTGLTKVGDYAEAVYTVRNDSNSIGAEITLNLTNSNSEYFKVTETILDNKLQAGEETTAKVRVEMIKTPVTDSVSTSVTATLTASPLEDAQASGGERKDEENSKSLSYVYTTSGVDDIYINTDISTWEKVYNSFIEAKEVFRHPAAIANIVNNGKVVESYLAFEKNDKVYYLKGRIDESSSLEKTTYDTNVVAIKEAFGPNWQTVCTTNSNRIYCSEGDLNVDAYTTGEVFAGGAAWSCDIEEDGNAYCVG